MLKLWQYDFEREMQVLHYAFKGRTQKEVQEWLERIAQEQKLPDNALYWVDASGQLHEQIPSSHTPPPLNRDSR